MTKKELFKAMDKNIQVYTYLGVIFGFVSIGITTIIALFYNAFLLIDVIIMLACVLTVLILKSRIASCILLAHYLLSQITSIRNGFGASPVIVTLFALSYIASIAGTFIFQSKWKQYQNSAQGDNDHTEELRQ